MMQVLQNFNLHSDDFESVNGKVRTISGKQSYQVRLNSNISTWGNTDDGSREITISSSVLNTRYIADIVGFFNIQR